jgi:cytochrome c
MNYELNQPEEENQKGLFFKLTVALLLIFLAVAAMVAVVTFGVQFWPDSNETVTSSSGESHANTESASKDASSPHAQQITWGKPQLDKAPSGMVGEYINYGHDLITKTHKHIGPNVPDPSRTNS